MKKAFQIATNPKEFFKIKLFSEQATVVGQQFHNAQLQETRNDVVIRDEKLVAAELQKEFLSFLDARQVKYAIISSNENGIMFAVAKGKYEEILGVINEFFSGSRNLARGVTYMNQAEDKLAILENKILKPFSRTRREVSKAVAKLKP